MNQTQPQWETRHLIYPIAILLIQVVGLLLMRAYVIQLFDYQPNGIPASSWPAYLLIGSLGSIGTIATLAAVYHLVRYAPPMTACTFLLFPCIPSLFLSLGYLYALLLFESTI